MIRWADVICCMLIMAAAYGLYMVKWEVHDLKRQNGNVQSEIAAQKEAITILDAEWAYLNRPERLHGLAQKYLQLQPEAGEQMIDLARLMIVPEEVQVAEEPALIDGAQLVSATSDTQQGF